MAEKYFYFTYSISAHSLDDTMLYFSALHLSVIVLLFCLFAECLHGDCPQGNIDPEQVLQSSMLQKAQGVRLEIVQPVEESRDFEGSFRSREPNFLAADTASFAHNVNLPHDAIFTAKKMRQCIDVKLKIESGAPVPQKRLDATPDFRCLLDGGIPCRIIYIEYYPVGKGERRVHKLVLDTFRSEVDQFAVTASGQQQVTNELRTMLVGQMANRLQFENGALINEQVDEIGFTEISVLHQNGDFCYGARSEYMGQFMLIRIFVKEPSQLVVDLECLLHYLIRNRSERLLIEDTEVFVKFNRHSKFLSQKIQKTVRWQKEDWQKNICVLFAQW